MNRCFIDFHVIQTLPPSCVNRDDTGSPKTARYGGVQRARVSSQCWKHSMRQMFKDHFNPCELGQRTKDITGLIMEQLPDNIQTDRNELRDLVREVVNLASDKTSKPIIPDISYDGIKKTLKDAAKEWKKDDDTESEPQLFLELKTVLAEFELEIDDAKDIDAIFKVIDQKLKLISGNKNNEQRLAFEHKLQDALMPSPLIAEMLDISTDALFFMGRQEAINIANLVVDYEKTSKKPDKKLVQEALNYYPKLVSKNQGSPSFAVDVALFGRMVAKSPVLNVDASAQVAHAISTHRVENEFDFFTAVDDRASKDSAGAAMLGTLEYNSSTLYRYATLALHELRKQFDNQQIVTKVVQEFARAFITSIPAGRQNGSAPHTPPDAILVSIRTDQPINLVGAFEEPVGSTGEGGFVKSSCARLVEYTEEIYTNFSVPEWSCVVGEKGLTGLGDSVSLSELLNLLHNEVTDRLGVEVDSCEA
jgi:CRISPR system Cascade subunit CasC